MIHTRPFTTVIGVHRNGVKTETRFSTSREARTYVDENTRVVVVTTIENYTFRHKRLDRVVKLHSPKVSGLSDPIFRC